jgi:hypothetical protein
MTFINAPQNELNKQKCFTANGAVGYETSGKKLLDLNFSVTSLRNALDQEIVDRFLNAYYENPMLAMKWLFYCRDCRQGIGERKLFRTVTAYLADTKPDIVKSALHLVSEYGRWDDLLCLLDTPVANEVKELIAKQYSIDIAHMIDGEQISLLAKWMPSQNTTSKETQRYAEIIRTYLGISQKQYRKMLSRMRKYLDVTERKMSAKEWSKINYEAVPSRANLIYSDAFLKHDEDRRTKYLEALSAGEAKINASTLFPDDIVNKYTTCWGGVEKFNATLEELWKALPTLTTDNTLVVRDGSGSMVGKPLDVSTAMAIYMAERSTGEFHNKFITFSRVPKWIDLYGMNTLREKIIKTYKERDCSNTDIEAVFELILRTAVDNKMSQEDMPKNIVIISDMQFDGQNFNFTEPLFEVIAQAYERHGHKLPRLVFWNVDEHHKNVIPIQQNELGVVLISGYSQNLIKMVMSGEADPYECLKKQLQSERYKPVEEALKNVIKETEHEHAE